MALPLFSVTLFVSAFILFLVQPIIGKLILPMLGGTPQVWNTCMVFFQTALLAGYSYTHTSSTRFTLRRQLIVHAGLLLIPIIFLFPPIWYTDPAGQDLITRQEKLLEDAKTDKDSKVLADDQMALSREVKESQWSMAQSASVLERAENLMTQAADSFRSGDKDAATGTAKQALAQLKEGMSRYLGPFNFRAWQSSIPLGSNPIGWALGLLALLVGLPFFVVATSSPLLQRWFVHTGHEAAKDPYFLSIASNVGSLLSLLAYPIFIEPYLSLAGQRYTWSVLYVLLGILIMVSASLVWKAPDLKSPPDPTEPEPAPMPVPEAAPPPAPAPTPTPAPAKAAPQVTGISRKKFGKKPGKPVPQAAVGQAPAPAVEKEPDIEIRDDNITNWRRFRWVMLAAAPSSLMLGVITYICTDLSPIPLLWVIPLALYLISFILVFARWPTVWVKTPHKVVLVLQPILVIGLALMLRGSFAGHLSVFGFFYIPMPAVHMSLAMLAFFATALVCHGEMAKDRPSARHLTEFYLWMSVGGMVGGMFNGLVAPVLFWGVLEFPLAIVLGCLLRPQQKGDGWSESLLHNFFPNLVSWFRNKGDELARSYKRPASHSTYALNFSLDVILPILLSGVVLLIAWLTFTDRIDTNPLFKFYKGSIGFTPNKAARAMAVTQDLMIVYLPMVICFLFYARPIRLGLAVGLLLLVQTFREDWSDRGIIYAGRSYFGVLRVREQVEELGMVHSLMHGSTHHGLNYQWGPQRRLATTYYHQFGPAGVVMSQFNWFKDGYQKHAVTTKSETGKDITEDKYVPSRWVKDMLANTSDARMPAALVGLCANMGTSNLPLDGIAAGLWAEPPFATIGLGTGTMAAYGRFFQHVHYYEIDRKIRLLSLPEDDVNFSDYYKGRAPRAVAEVEDGKVTRIKIIRRSSAYATIPKVTLTGGDGSGATAKIHMTDGVIRDIMLEDGRERDGIEVVSGGSGYTSPPTVMVEDPQPTPHFNYLHDAKFKRASIVQVRMGDARLRMAMPYAPYNEEEERKGASRGGGPDNFYHMMVVDAFSSDAIPIHLITKEAIEMYMKKLTPEGILCVHTSNRHVDLVPVVERVVAAIREAPGSRMPDLACMRGHDAAPFSDHGDRNPFRYAVGEFTSEWVMVARNMKILERLPTPPLYEYGMEQVERFQYREAKISKEKLDEHIEYLRERGTFQYWAPPNPNFKLRAWTDDYSNVFSVFRW